MTSFNDYIIIGTGLWGATFAYLLRQQGRRVLLVDRAQQVGGHAATGTERSVLIHRHGPHIFHTNDPEIWSFVNRFATFKPFINSPLANYRGELYALPFNMHTFYKMWGVKNAAEAQAIIKRQIVQAGISSPGNLEEQAICLVGTDIYKTLIQGYTEKQWGRPCSELPASIIRRLPLRFNFDNNYYNACYQGIPAEGYTKLVSKMLDGTAVILGVDYLQNRDVLNKLAHKIVYTGPIDAYFNYCYGELAYRSLRFETDVLECPDFQGNAVVNYTDKDTAWTRIIEHKWFNGGLDIYGRETAYTVITREYPQPWQQGIEAYYPVNDEKNAKLYIRYKQLADQETNVIFGGRLAEYKYYDMDQVIASAMAAAEYELNLGG